jgi:hypothetical protein
MMNKLDRNIEQVRRLQETVNGLRELPRFIGSQEESHRRIEPPPPAFRADTSIKAHEVEIERENAMSS